jgi:hypothetical protein
VGVYLLNIHLPSARRKRFLLLFLFFLFVGFSTKYLLSSFHAADSQTIVTSAPFTATDATLPKDDVHYTAQEIAQAEQMIKTFMPIYGLQDPTQTEKRLAQLRGMATPAFYRILQAESEQARPTKEASLLHWQQVNQVGCEQDGIRLKCLVVTEWKDAENRRWERVYECNLIHLQQEWLVEEMKVCGSLD